MNGGGDPGSPTRKGPGGTLKPGEHQVKVFDTMTRQWVGRMG